MKNLTAFLAPTLEVLDELTQSNIDFFHKTYKPFLPYNYYKDKDGNQTFEMSVAGYSKDNISVVFEDGILEVEGKVADSDHIDTWFHQGLAKRQFSIKVPVANGFLVKNAKLVDGILKVTFYKNTLNRASKIEIE